MKEIEKNEEDTFKEEIRDANSCMAIGVGVGAAGAGAAVLVGALCPLCVIVAPALIGIGALKRCRLKVQQVGSESSRVGSGEKEVE